MDAHFDRPAELLAFRWSAAQVLDHVALTNHLLMLTLATLDRRGGGTEALPVVAMTVNDLGKLDLYQWLMFLARHAERHLMQLESIGAEFALRGATR